MIFIRKNSKGHNSAKICIFDSFKVIEGTQFSFEKIQRGIIPPKYVSLTVLKL